MKLVCDQCGIEYEGEEDNHWCDEPNLCCAHCEWNYYPQPVGDQPPHTCKPAKERVHIT